MRKVIIAEQHKMVREALASRIEALGYDLVADVGTPWEALELAQDECPGIVILDLARPCDTLDTVRRLHDLATVPRILICTGREEESFAVDCLRAGVDGYLLKSLPIETIEEALARLASGRRFMSEELACRLVNAIDTEEEPRACLSARETEVAEGISSGHTITEISRSLELSVKTVSTYRTRILEKLGVKGNSELTRYWMSSAS